MSAKAFHRLRDVARVAFARLGSRVSTRPIAPVCSVEPLEQRLQFSAGVLTPTLQSVTLPASVLGDAKTSATAAVELTNSSAAEVTGPATVQLYFSTTPTVTSGSDLITSFKKSVKLKAGGVEALKIKLKEIPDVPNGNYWLVVNVTDPSGGTAAVASTGTTTVAAAYVALSEKFSTLTIPSSVQAGSAIKAVAAVDITNNGNVPSTGPTAVALYASTTPTFSASDTQLASVDKSLAIKPSASKLLNIPLKSIPAGLADGTYYIVAKVTDPKGDVTTAASSATFQLAAVTQSISVAFATPLPADPLTSGATVILTNNGSSTVKLLSDSYDEGFSTDAAGQDSIGGVVAGFFLGGPTQIKPHGSVTLRLNGWKSITVASGTYYLTFQFVGLGGVTLATAVSPTAVSVS